MTSHGFGALVEVQSSPGAPSHNQTLHRVPTAPQKAKARTYHSRPASPDIELESIQWNTLDYGSIPQTPAAETPATENERFFQDLERSRTASPADEFPAGNRSVEALQSFSSPPMNRYRMLSACLMNFGNGLSDSAPGALLP